MLSVCYGRGNKGLESLRNLSAVTQLVCDRQGSTPEPTLVDTTKLFRRLAYIYILHYILGMVSGRLIIFYSLIIIFRFQNQII